MAYTNAIYNELKKRGNLHGTATRPSGSDGYWPPAGTTVAWVLSQPIQDLVDQGKKLGWQNLGTIGDTYHRKLHGDHTPWSAGKNRCVLYAKDTKTPSWFESAMLKLMRTANYDTTWIDFVNINGKQYNYAGQRVASSGDYHLHVSVRKGHEKKHVTLFLDAYNTHHGKPLEGGDDLPSVKDVWSYDPSDSTGVKNPAWRADSKTNPTVKPSYGIYGAWDEAHKAGEEAKAARAEIAALRAEVQKLQTGGVDMAELADMVVDKLSARLAD